MKNIETLALIISTCLVLILASCRDDKIIEIEDTIVSFKNASAAILETEKETTITINFDKPTMSSGTIKIKVIESETIQYATNFTTTPPKSNNNNIVLDVEKGALSTSFKFLPIEDESKINSGIIQFKITEVTDGLEIGLGDAFVLILRETPQLATNINTVNFQDTYTGSFSLETYILNAVGITEDITIVASEGFSISTDDLSYATEIDIVKEDILANPITIYVKFSPTIGIYGNLTGNITHSSLGVEDVLINVQGTSLENTATINSATTTIVFPETIENETSEIQEYEVTAINLTENILVSSTSFFEVSLDGITFSNQIALDFTQLNTGTSSTVYTRFAPISADNPSISGTITHTSLGANTLQINVNGTTTYNWQQIAYTSFEEPTGLDKSYQDTGDASTNHELINNDDQNPVSYQSTGNELGFRTFYETTGGTGSTDEDDLGVTTKTSIVGTHFEGEQSYVVDDTDGIIKIKFDAVDISNLSQLRLTYSFLINNTSYEESDYFKVYVVDNQGVITLITDYNGNVIEADSLDDENWHTINTPIPSVIGNTTVQLVIEVRTSSGSEELYFDYINFEGVN